MRLDPEVARIKFFHEVEKIQEKHEEGLRKRGCWILNSNYPNVDVLFVCQRPLRITFPTFKFGMSQNTPTQIAQETREFRHLSARQFGVRIGLDDFDQRPPSVSFRDPFTWEYLTEMDAPPSLFVDENGQKLRAIPGKHPHTDRLFLCAQGIREYHDHPQHSGDSWQLHRSHRGLLYILNLICETCIENVHPMLTWHGGQFIRTT